MQFFHYCWFLIHEIYVQPQDWMAGRKLMELKLSDEGVLVLGIVRNDGRYLGTPRGTTEVKPADTLILYGRNSDIARLDRRKKGPGGNIQHAGAVAAQRIKKKNEDQTESEPE